MSGRSMGGRLTGVQRAELRAKSEADPTPIWLLDAGGGLFVRDASIRGIYLDRIKSSFAFTCEVAASDAREWILKAYPDIFGSPLTIRVFATTLGAARKMAREDGKRGRR